MPADSRASRMAAASSDDSTLPLAPSANCASASDRASAILASAARKLRWISDSSIIFAMKIVHVTSEAKASPIITALTRISADKNIDQGDSSRSAGAVDFSDLAPSAEVAPVSEAAGAGAVAIAADGAGVCAVGAAWTGTGTGCDAAGAFLAVVCCADDGDTKISISTADIIAWIARGDEGIIWSPPSGTE